MCKYPRKPCKVARSYGNLLLRFALFHHPQGASSHNLLFHSLDSHRMITSTCSLVPPSLLGGPGGGGGGLGSLSGLGDLGKITSLSMILSSSQGLDVIWGIGGAGGKAGRGGWRCSHSIWRMRSLRSRRISSLICTSLLTSRWGSN